MAKLEIISKAIFCDNMNFTVEDLIKKLQALPANSTIEQEWTGYEDCHFEVHTTRLETDDEKTDRLAEEVLAAEEEQRVRVEEQQRRQRLAKADKLEAEAKALRY